ncbi:MAG: hypothetical protein N3A61_01585, partial [Ignavibacteria bacterium]|nr:hypothetical protein [Ignavibacteria bacterium]
NHNFTFSYTNQLDFYYFSPLSIEFPLTRDIYLLNWNSKITIQNFVFKPRVNYTINKIKGWLNNTLSLPDWRMQFLSCNFDVESENDEYYFGGGVGVNYFGIQNDFNNKADKSSLLKFYSKFEIKLGKEFLPVIDLFMSLQENKYYGKFATSFLWLINNNQYLKGSISYSENPYIDEQNYSFWQNKNIFHYNYENNNILSSQKQKITTLDFEYTPANFSEFKLSLDAGYRFFSNFYIEDYRFFYIPAYENFAVEIIKPESNSGKVIYGKISLGIKIFNEITSAVDYLYQKYVDGNDNFKNNWEVLPNHSLICTLLFEMSQSFSIQTSMRYTSSSNWINYHDIEGISYGKYSSRLNPKTLIDVSIQKWMWRKRIWLNLVIRNLLKQKEIYHPIGADLGMRFFFQANIYLDSIL